MPKFRVTVVYMGEFSRTVEAADADEATKEAQKLYDEGTRALPEMEVRTHLYAESLEEYQARSKPFEYTPPRGGCDWYGYDGDRGQCMSKPTEMIGNRPLCAEHAEAVRRSVR